jgi:undecaprenyl-diphosphatase
MDIIQVIILALIQGLTEFLPISSSAHLILPAELTDWPDQGLAFDIAVHAGSLTAVMVYFRSDLARFLQSLWNWLTRREYDVYVRLVGQVVLATLPIVLLGLLLRDWIEEHSRSYYVIAATTIGFGLLLWIADDRAVDHGATEYELSWRDALVIGCLQILAIVPGTSRAGITITAGLLLGMSREGAARFSFLLSIPTILGAATLGAWSGVKEGIGVPWSDVLVGFTLSGITAFICIHFFIKLIERTGMRPYVYYRLVLGTVLIGLGVVGAI